MNPILERLQTAYNGLKHFDKVVEGMLNYSTFKNLSKEKQEIVSERLQTCIECPLNSINAKLSEEYFKLTGEHYETTKKELHCAMCGCYTKYKTSSLSSNCGLEIWNQEHPENKQPLKWKSI